MLLNFTCCTQLSFFLWRRISYVFFSSNFAQGGRGRFQAFLTDCLSNILPCHSHCCATSLSYLELTCTALQSMMNWSCVLSKGKGSIWKEKNQERVDIKTRCENASVVKLLNCETRRRPMGVGEKRAALCLIKTCIAFIPLVALSFMLRGFGLALFIRLLIIFP